MLASAPARVDLKYLERFPELARFRGDAAEPLTAAVAADVAARTPDEIARDAVRGIDATLAQELLDRILKAPPAFFEQVIAQLAMRLGYGGGRDEAVRVVGRGGDGGVDVEIDEDPLGVDRLFLQAKRYQQGSNIGEGTVRDFAGALRLRNTTKGVLVTTSAFTAAAVTAAERLGILLIDGGRLAHLMLRHEVGVRVAETLRIMRVDEDFFPE